MVLFNIIAGCRLRIKSFRLPVVSGYGIHEDSTHLSKDQMYPKPSSFEICMVLVMVRAWGLRAGLPRCGGHRDALGCQSAPCRC